MNYYSKKLSYLSDIDKIKFKIYCHLQILHIFTNMFIKYMFMKYILATLNEDDCKLLILILNGIVTIK